MMKRAVRRFSDFKGMIPLGADKIATLPPWMEFYKPVIEHSASWVEAIQGFTGCPWWLSIACLTFGIRATMAPWLVLQMKSLGPLAKTGPEFRVLLDLLKYSKASFPRKLFTALSTTRQLFKKHKVSAVRGFTYGFLQVPHFLTYVWSVRYLCATNSELQTGGTLWFTDLTESDPYMILPVISCSLTYLNLQRGITPQTKDWLISRIKGTFQIAVILSLPVASHWPAVSSK